MLHCPEPIQLDSIGGTKLGKIELWIPFDAHQQPRGSRTERESRTRNDLSDVRTLHVAVGEDCKSAGQLRVGLSSDRLTERSGDFIACFAGGGRNRSAKWTLRKEQGQDEASY